MKLILLVLGLMVIAWGCDAVPGCMCLDCRERREEIILPKGYKTEDGEHDLREDWLKSNPQNNIVELISK